MTNFLLGCRQLLGPDYVDGRPGALNAAATATYATHQRVLAILRPGSVAEAASCLRLACRHRVPVYPISGGRNWGLGSRVPTQDACLLDLSRLNRILDYDARLGTITVEPGVTFRQVAGFLKQHKSAFYLASIGGPADSSVIGNCAERGDGCGPTGERLANLCGLEVILPTGDIVRTGHLGSGRLADLGRDAAGPQLDGMFTQSNLGVITRASIWLSPLPENLYVLQCQLGKVDNVRQFVEQLRWLVVRGIVPASCFSIWNSWKLLVREGLRNQLLAPETSIPSIWYGCGFLMGSSPAHGKALLDLAKAALEPHCESFWVTASEENPALSSHDGPLASPTDANARSVYWAKPSRPDDRTDPDADRCGVIWLCPALAFCGEHVGKAIETVERILPQHGFDPIAGMHCVTPRTIHAFVSLYYDRDEPGGDQRAMSCHDALAGALDAIGANPYRLGVHSMNRWRQPEDPYARLVGTIKQALDPQRVLAPGRYETLPNPYFSPTD